MTSPNEHSQATASHSSDATRTFSREPDLRLVLNGYVPTSHNRARGAHWSFMHQEKLRAAKFLRVAIESDLLSTRCDRVTGTTTGQRLFKTALSLLDCYRVTTGKRSKAKC